MSNAWLAKAFGVKRRPTFTQCRVGRRGRLAHFLFGITLMEPSFSSNAARTSSTLLHPASRRALMTSWRVSLARSKVCEKSLPSWIRTSGPSFDQSFQFFASISEEPNDPVDHDQGHR